MPFDGSDRFGKFFCDKLGGDAWPSGEVAITDGLDPRGGDGGLLQAACKYVTRLVCVDVWYALLAWCCARGRIHVESGSVGTVGWRGTFHRLVSGSQYPMRMMALR